MPRQPAAARPAAVAVLNRSDLRSSAGVALTKDDSRRRHATNAPAARRTSPHALHNDDHVGITTVRIGRKREGQRAFGKNAGSAGGYKEETRLHTKSVFYSHDTA